MTSSPEQGPIRVLIVDDSAAIHEDFRRILCPPEMETGALDALETELFEEPRRVVAPARFRLDVASQGEQALQLLRDALEHDDPYQLVFVDVRMPPGIDGIETLARALAVDPRVQAVICSAYSDHSWSDVVRTLGRSDGFLVLRKPFDTIEVLQIAHALAQKWQLSREVEKQLRTMEATIELRTQDLQRKARELEEEISTRERAERELAHIATHDGLTGLPNRVLLRDRIVGAIARAQRSGKSFAALLVDLDDFREVNDSYGHAAGDEVLRTMATRLRGLVRGSDTIARMGGDEFAVLLEELEQPEEAVLIAKRIIDACSLPCLVNGVAARTPPSIGIAVFPNDGGDPESLLKMADLAMYRAKEAGRSTFAFYSRNMLENSVERFQLRDRLDLALAENQLELWYQPIVELSTGAVSGLEALLRWRHPELGLVPPLKFIPLAEKTGQIVAIGVWVLETACRQLAEWQREFSRELSVSVNVSARQLQSRDVVDATERAFKSAGVEPRCLELEITETAAMADAEDATRIVRELAALGARISIDDFGSGYSSLSRLKTLPIDDIKIDRSLVMNVGADPRDSAIVTAIVEMASACGMGFVAEGIEEVAQLEFLRRLDERSRAARRQGRAQGYLLSKPLPREAATAYLRDARAKPRSA